MGWGMNVLGADVQWTRSFRLGFSTTPFENIDKTYLLIKKHGDLVSHSLVDGVPWIEALSSSDYRSYSQDLQRWWEYLRKKDEKYIPGHKKYIVVSPIESSKFKTLAPYWGKQRNMPIPSPWDKYEFNHPNVKKAYVNYLIAVVKFFKPKYLAINMEANILLAQSPKRWNAFKELNRYAYTRIKEHYPDLIVFSSIQYEDMLGLTRWSADLVEEVKGWYPDVLKNEVRLLLQHSDLMGISTFPYTVAWNEVDPYYYEPAVTIAEDLKLPIAIEQTGYISEDFSYPPLNITLPGSEALQNDFLGFILYQAWLHKFEFVVNFVAVDYKPFPSLYDNVWATTGLLRNDGSSKKALGSWDEFFKMPFNN